MLDDSGIKKVGMGGGGAENQDTKETNLGSCLGQ